MKRGAVSVDLGASSARFAAGELEGGELRWRVIRQVKHDILSDGTWDLETLLGLVREAKAFAESEFDSATLGIDGWGVDFGYVDQSGRLLEAPVAYRDRRHEEQFEAMAALRDELYALTGIQHQPFNTFYQLAARPRDAAFRFLPDLLGELAFGHTAPGAELTIASTSQLLDLKGEWCPRAFELLGRPVPSEKIVRPGTVRARDGKVTLLAVGGHDTASAVFGLDPGAEEAYLNVGTWALLGTLLDSPLTTDPFFTNERAVDGRVRYLANVPGFYVVNRLYEELRPVGSLVDWIAAAEPTSETVDLFRAEFFNPPSMVEAMRLQLSAEPGDWAGLALTSLAQAARTTLDRLQAATGQSYSAIKLGGGASESARFRDILAAQTGREVRQGPREATLVGNLRLQLTTPLA